MPLKKMNNPTVNGRKEKEHSYGFPNQEFPAVVELKNRPGTFCSEFVQGNESISGAGQLLNLNSRLLSLFSFEKSAALLVSDFFLQLLL